MYSGWLEHLAYDDEDNGSEHDHDDEDNGSEHDYDDGYNGSEHDEDDQEKITEHEIVKRWRSELIAMSSDLSTLFEKSTDDPLSGVFRQMGITTSHSIQKWHAVCNMRDHEDFDFFITTTLSSDIEAFVKPRLKYVLDYLLKIETKDQTYIRRKYISRLQNALRDQWRWLSLLDKWRLQFDYMQYDLVDHFGSEEKVENYFGGPEKWEEFQSLLRLKDDSFDHIEDGQEFCYQDYSTDLDRIVSFVKKTIEDINTCITEADGRAWNTGVSSNIQNANWVNSMYMEPFMMSLNNEDEWERLIGVTLPSTKCELH